MLWSVADSHPHASANSRRRWINLELKLQAQGSRVRMAWRASLSSIVFVTTARQSSTTTSSTMKPATSRPFIPRPAIRRRLFINRSYAVQAPGSPTLQVFNRHTKYLQKERAAANVESSRRTDYLKDEVAMRLSERLLVSFNNVNWTQLSHCIRT